MHTRPSLDGHSDTALGLTPDGAGIASRGSATADGEPRGLSAWVTRGRIR